MGHFSQVLAHQTLAPVPYKIIGKTILNGDVECVVEYEMVLLYFLYHV